MANAFGHKKTTRLIETDKFPEYKDIRKGITSIKLPMYSLDLNPIDKIWCIMCRESDYNVYFASLSTLKTTVNTASEV